MIKTLGDLRKVLSSWEMMNLPADTPLGIITDWTDPPRFLRSVFVEYYDNKEMDWIYDISTYEGDNAVKVIALNGEND